MVRDPGGTADGAAATRRLHPRHRQDGNGVPHQRLARRRGNHLHRQVRLDRARAHHHRALAAGGEAGVRRHLGQARRRQDYRAEDGPASRHWVPRLRRSVVNERGGAAQGADVLSPARRSLYSVGQHRTRHADRLPEHRALVHLSLLYRPQTRRERGAGRARDQHPRVHRQTTSAFAETSRRAVF